jgi:lysophospholipase L1-like esterase
MSHDDANWFNVSQEWLGRIGMSLERLRAGKSDFRIANVGDSIATGMWGIGSTSDHYAARAAEAIAGSLEKSARQGLITCGADDEGRVRIDGGDWRHVASNSGFFGAGAFELASGGNAELTYRPGARAPEFRIGFRGDAGLRYSVDGGGSWIEYAPSDAASANETPDGCVRLDATGASDEIRIRAWDRGPATRVYFLDSVDSASAAVTWFTSGIGASRMGDLHAALSANNGSGFNTYGAAELDLLAIEIGVNNTIHADEVGIEESAAALRATVEGFISHGVSNIVLVGANPVRSDFQPGPWDVADAYTEIYRPISLDYGTPLLELATRWGDWARAHELGLIDDQVHPTRDGHQDAGAIVAGLVLSATAARELGQAT